MPLKDTEKVDVIVKSPHTGGYDLIAVDSGDVSDAIERYNLFVQKMTSYANFVLSGQLEESYPDAKGKQIRFCVICSVVPNSAMLQVQAIQPPENPAFRFPVFITTQDGYLKNVPYEDLVEDKTTQHKKPWWKVW